MDTTVMKTFLDLDRQRKKLEGEVKALKSQLEKLMPKVEEELLQAGVDSIKIDNGTVTTRKTLWAKPKNGDYPLACAALKQAGLGDFVAERFNTQTLSAYVRELVNEGEPLPEPLQEAIEVSEVIKVVTRG